MPITGKSFLVANVNIGERRPFKDIDRRVGWSRDLVTTIDCLAKAGFELESPACKDIELDAVGRHFAGTAGCGVCMLAAPLGVTWDAVPEQSWL